MVRDPEAAIAGIRDGIAKRRGPGPTMRVSGTALARRGHSDGYIPSLGVRSYGGFFVPDHPNRGPYWSTGWRRSGRCPPLLRHQVD